MERSMPTTVVAPARVQIAKGVSKSRLVWEDEHYTIPGSLKFRPAFLFDIYSKNKNNKEMGKIRFKPSFIEEILSDVDVLQIKTCRKCFTIFFAEPRNMKFCSKECNNQMKSKRYYYKNKLNQ
jgi:hypothetical protein